MTSSSTVRGSTINTTQAVCSSILNMNKFVPVLHKQGDKLPDLYPEGCHVHTSYPDTNTLNLQNIEDKHADQPVETHATPYSIHVLPMLHRCGWKQLIFKNVYARYFVECYKAHYVSKMLTVWF